MSEQIRAESASRTSNRLLAGKYEVIGEVSRGAFGRILKVRQIGLDKVLAAKVLADKSSNEEAFRRLAREGQILTKLSHPNIVKVYSAAVDDSAGFIVIMDYLDGVPLSQMIRDKQLNLALAVDLLKQMCVGLAYAHENGILHRDLKPSNVMVMSVDNRKQAVLIDFGIAKVQDASQKLTQTGALLGTPLYMSPEQLTGAALDARSDVYSLGCTFYEMLTGQPPFPGETWIELAAKHQVAPVHPPSELLPDIPADLEQIVLKCMEKNPDDRYSSVLSLADALGQANLQLCDRKPSRKVKTVKLHPNTMRVVIACAATMILAGVGLVALQMYSHYVRSANREKVAGIQVQERQIGQLMDANQLASAQGRLTKLIDEINGKSAEARELPMLYVMLAKTYRLTGDYANALRAIDSARKFRDRFDLPTDINVETGKIYFGDDKFEEAIGVLNDARNDITEIHARLESWLWRAKALIFKSEERAADKWRRYSDANSDAIKIGMHYGNQQGPDRLYSLSHAELTSLFESSIICAFVLNRQTNFANFGPRNQNWGSGAYIDYLQWVLKAMHGEKPPLVWMAAREEVIAEYSVGIGQLSLAPQHIDQMERYIAQISPPATAFEAHENKLWVDYLRNRIKELRANNWKQLFLEGHRLE